MLKSIQNKVHKVNGYGEWKIFVYLRNIYVPEGISFLMH
jgi:hypothetical protein